MQNWTQDHSMLLHELKHTHMKESANTTSSAFGSDDELAICRFDIVQRGRLVFLCLDRGVGLAMIKDQPQNHSQSQVQKP